MNNKPLNDDLISDFLGDLLFDEDTTKLKEFMLELDNKNRKFFINIISGFINDTKNKLGDTEDLPQEFIDMEARVNAVLKEIGPTTPTKTNITESKKKIIVLLVLIISLVVCFVIAFFVPKSHNTPMTAENAVEKAENAVAIYLTKNYNSNKGTYNKFMSFEKIYHTTKLDGSEYIIELSGSANIGKDNKFDIDFYAKVSVSLSSDEVIIENLIFGDSELK